MKNNSLVDTVFPFRMMKSSGNYDNIFNVLNASELYA